MISTNYGLFQRLQDIREDLDLTQREMANQLKVSQSCYSRWETGKELIPLQKLSDFCSITNHSMDCIAGLIHTERKVPKRNYPIRAKVIGKNLKEVRIQHGLYQYQLAKILNTTQSTISAYESGETLILTAFIYQIAKEFHLSLDELCSPIGKMKKRKQL